MDTFDIFSTVRFARAEAKINQFKNVIESGYFEKNNNFKKNIRLYVVGVLKKPKSTLFGGQFCLRL